MKLSAKQKKFARRVLHNLPRRFDADMVYTEARCGATTAARLLSTARNKPDAKPRVLWLDADKPWDAVLTLCRAANVIPRGGYGDSLFMALEALSGPARVPLVLLLDQAEELNERATEHLLGCLEWAALNAGVSTRAVFLIGKVSTWNNDKQAREPRWPALTFRLRERLLAEKRKPFIFTREVCRMANAREAAKLQAEAERQPAPADEKAQSA